MTSKVIAMFMIFWLGAVIFNISLYMCSSRWRNTYVSNYSFFFSLSIREVLLSVYFKIYLLRCLSDVREAFLSLILV